VISHIVGYHPMWDIRRRSNRRSDLSRDRAKAGAGEALASLAQDDKSEDIGGGAEAAPLQDAS